ncbi:MAG: branched-chain amino acid aminotransferase [Bdellovibrionales bacterium]|nr:branched-chain amino acid aminotransferase [Bdellovibrionales bacterium]
MNIVQKLPPLGELGFGKYFAPWMIVSHYRDGHWTSWNLTTTEDFHISPADKVLHYAQEIFEGLKVFKLNDGSAALFRPEKNIRRMARSSEILAMPAYPEADFLDGMIALSRKCKDLVPNEPGALYLRPTMIATSTTLGVAPSQEYSFFILASPVGGYFGDTQSDKPAGVSVLVSQDHVRAVRGGLGEAKTGANYAASLRAVSEAKKQKYDNVLFLDAIDRCKLEELSGMNVFVVDGGVLKTPKLGDTILRGITRETLLHLAKLENIPTEETDIDVHELIAGLGRGTITEIFACGTGASVTAITELGWKGERLPVAGKRVGDISTRLYRRLLGIQTGRLPAPEANWLVRC